MDPHFPRCDDMYLNQFQLYWDNFEELFCNCLPLCTILAKFGGSFKLFANLNAIGIHLPLLSYLGICEAGLDWRYLLIWWPWLQMKFAVIYAFYTTLQIVHWSNKKSVCNRIRNWSVVSVGRTALQLIASITKTWKSNCGLYQNICHSNVFYGDILVCMLVESNAAVELFQIQYIEILYTGLPHSNPV